jgi:hypothetical protein
MSEMWNGSVTRPQESTDIGPAVCTPRNPLARPAGSGWLVRIAVRGYFASGSAYRRLYEWWSTEPSISTMKSRT